MKSVKVVKLNHAKIGDLVDVTTDDCWRTVGVSIHYGFEICKGTLRGLVIGIKRTSLHDHEFLVIVTAYGTVYVKKGGW